MMARNWSAIWNRVFKLIDTEGDSYYKGSKFIAAVQESVDPYFPSYNDSILGIIELNKIVS